MKILNLGCGTKTSADPSVINIDWSIALRVKRRKLLTLFAPIFFRGERLRRFRSLPDNIMVHNLAKGIPFAANSVDAVYHSHLFEHLERGVAREFAREVHRVLKPGGIHRIVVPDLEEACQLYLAHLQECDSNPAERRNHDAYVEAIIEQCVRIEAGGTARQGPLRRRIENLVLGDARKRGEAHQWMYDRVNLSSLLIDCGYREVHIQQYNSSLIPNWIHFGLDSQPDGTEYRTDSMYVEAVK
jgi:SAM-dependent methyltransferase